MLGLSVMRSTHLLLSLPGPLWPGVVAPDRFLSMDKIELNSGLMLTWIVYWRSRDELISDVLLWTPSHGREKTGQPAGTYIYSSSVGIRDVALRTSQKRWTIGRSGERGPGISVLVARQDDDDDDDISKMDLALNNL